MFSRWTPTASPHGRGSSHRWLAPAARPNNAAPSVQPHYRAFIPTTDCSAPVPRFGTLILVGAAHLDFSLRIGATGSQVPHTSEVTPPPCRRARNQDTRPACPGVTTTLRFRHHPITFDTSSAVRFRSSSQSLPDEVQPRLFLNAHHTGS